MSEDQSRIVSGSIVRHFKGDLYLVLHIAQHTETGEQYVVYKALYGKGELWVRPYDMFTSKVSESAKNPLVQVYRFEIYEPEKIG